MYLGLLETPEQKSFFEKIYNEFRGMMYAKAVGILHDSHLAEDAVHTAFARVAYYYEAISVKMLDGKSIEEVLKTNNLKKECPKIGGYLIVIVRNVSYDMFKVRRRFEYTEDENELNLVNEEYALGADDEFIINEKTDKILKALNAVNEASRDALYLSVVYDMDARMVSELLDCNYDAVRKRIQRGKAELRKILSDESE